MPFPNWPVPCGTVGERSDMVVGQQSPVFNRLPGACSRGYLIGVFTNLKQPCLHRFVIPEAFHCTNSQFTYDGEVPPVVLHSAGVT
ncbi:hypothetical protein [Massilia luteola]|uniref:hypothetical protein n=1 Tax=Massilia luteola TaxID=3081751 RepID=UPI002ACC0F52|nr:hypothetical protein [Massilia sp. Gc5]